MGKARARTDEELAARKSEILEAAKEQILVMDYDAVTLATIAEKTSISRPSMYHYYEKKEAVFVDLLIQEYQELEKDLQPKLLSLQLPVWRYEYSDEARNMFRVQFSVYCHSLYVIEHLPQSQMTAMEDQKR